MTKQAFYPSSKTRKTFFRIAHRKDGWALYVNRKLCLRGMRHPEQATRAARYMLNLLTVGKPTKKRIRWKLHSKPGYAWCWWTAVVEGDS